MTTWRWVDLGAVDGPTMVNVFVAVAGSVGSSKAPPTVIWLYPGAPFANVGFHQDADREIDLEYCRQRGIPVVRRVVGGGAILDGPWEQDYMVIVPAGSPGTTGGIPEFYEHYLRPVQGMLSRLGIRAERSGVNDLAVGGRKISANGALFLDGSWVFVGDVLLDLDLESMNRILRVPDEKFRGKLAQNLDRHLTSVTRETGRLPDREALASIFRQEFQSALGVELVPGPLMKEETSRLESLRGERTQDSWTFQKEAAHPRLHPDLSAPGGPRTIKIAHGVHLGQVDRKVGKLLRVLLLSRDNRVEEVEISGDFFTEPFEGRLGELERGLAGCPLTEGDLSRAISTWQSRHSVRLIGISPEDIVQALLDAARPSPSISPTGPPGASPGNRAP
jgi:lipoate-protein ligase A